MDQDKNPGLERRHVIKLKQIRELLLADLVLWRNPEMSSQTARNIIFQLEQSLEINASYIEIAEERLAKLKDYE